MTRSFTMLGDPIRPAPEPASVRFPDAARRLGVSTATVRRLVRAGKIRAVYLGRAVVIPSSELERVLAAPAPERLG